MVDMLIAEAKDSGRVVENEKLVRCIMIPSITESVTMRVWRELEQQTVGGYVRLPVIAAVL